MALIQNGCEQISSLFSALYLSESRVVVQGQQTLSKFEHFLATLQERFNALSDENQKLQQQLVASVSREHEVVMVHKKELEALQQKAETAQKEVAAVRQEMATAAKYADDRVAAALLAQNEAVKVATQEGETYRAAAHAEINTLKSQLETVRQEKAQQLAEAEARKNAAVQTATQVGAAKEAAALQEATALRQEVTGLRDTIKTLTARITALENKLQRSFTFQANELQTTIGCIFTHKFCSFIAAKRGEAANTRYPVIGIFIPR